MLQASAIGGQALCKLQVARRVALRYMGMFMESLA